MKLAESLKKGYATIYYQCSEAVKEIHATEDWDKMQQEQLLHDLICKIERICVGFDDHKQEVFSLVQALKTLFLYTQLEKERIEEYEQNFKSLWKTVGLWWIPRSAQGAR